MGVPEFNMDSIWGEVNGVLDNGKLPLPSHVENVPGDVDIYHPSEQQARDAAVAFERNIQRPHVLLFFDLHVYILNKLPDGKRLSLYRREFYSYITDRVARLRSKNNHGEADVLEKTDTLAALEIVRMQTREDIQELGRQIPGTGGYSNIDSRIKFLDRWEKLCDELVDLEKSEGTS